ARVETVLNELFDDRNRALDDLTGGDLSDRRVVEHTNGLRWHGAMFAGASRADLGSQEFRFKGRVGLDQLKLSPYYTTTIVQQYISTANLKGSKNHDAAIFLPHPLGRAGAHVHRPSRADRLADFRRLGSENLRSTEHNAYGLYGRSALGSAD